MRAMLDDRTAYLLSEALRTYNPMARMLGSIEPLEAWLDDSDAAQLLPTNDNEAGVSRAVRAS